MTPDTIWKLVAVTLYAAVLLFIGWAASRRMSDIRDYFAAGKKLGFINAAFSARATGESAWLLLGLTGTGFAVGVQGFWIVIGEVIGVAGAWLIMAKPFKRLCDHYDAITVPDYLEARMRDAGHGLRIISALSLLILVPIYAGSQVFAAGQAFNSFFGWNELLGASIGFAIVLVYTTGGGFTAVVWSDVFQGSLMLIGLVALPIVGVMEAGGVTNIIETLRGIDPDLLSWHGPGPVPDDAYVPPPETGSWNALTITKIFGFAAIGIGFMGSPQVIARFLSLKSEKEVSKGAAAAVLWTILADSGAVLVGIVGRGLYEWTILQPDPALIETGTSEKILPHMAEVLLPSFLTGAFIAMVLSAIMSTVDSLLVVASGAAVRDYWQKIKRPDMPDDKLVRTSKILTLILALIAYGIGMALLANNPDKPVFWVIIFGWSAIAATFCPTVILSLFWRGLTTAGAKASMVAGFIAAPTLTLTLNDPLAQYTSTPLFNALGIPDAASYILALDILLPSFVIGMIVAVAVSLPDTQGRARLGGTELDTDFDIAKGKK
ncbi:MAG: sodium/proline symporter [Planctomycetota bacterium]